MASIRIQRGLFNRNRTGLWRIPIHRLSIIHSRLLIDDHSIISLIARKEKNYANPPIVALPRLLTKLYEQEDFFHYVS